MSGIQQLLLGGVPGEVTDPYFENTTLLLPGTGTNGAQNNTFLDSSTNNFTITRNGNTTQGTFSPFSQTGWSNYFDGTANGFLSTPPTTDLDLSGDFTLQAWIFPVADSQSAASEILSRGAPATLNGWHFYYYNNKLNFGFNYAGFLGANNTTIPKNVWSHVALTRNGNTFTYYLNGVSDGTFTSSATPTTNGSDVVYVGRGSYDTSNRQFPGYMAQVSVIKGTALTTFSQTTPLSTGTSGQSLLTCTANRFVDTNTATTAKTLTAGSGVSVQAFSPFNPTAAYSAATNGGSGYFDGNGDYLNTASNSAFNLGTGTFTVEAWVYCTNPSANSGYSMLINRTRLSTAAGWGLWIQASKFGFWVSGSSTQINDSATVQPNTWYHVAAVRDSSNVITLYVNGASVATSTVASFTDAVTALGIGARAETDSWNAVYPMNGYISGVRVVKGTAVYTANFTPPTAPPTNITNTSLLCNFTNAGVYDATAKNDLETVADAQISNTTAKWGSTSIKFDGTGDRLQIPDSPGLRLGTGDFTIEGWFYTTTLSGVRSIFYKSQSDTNGVVFAINNNGAGVANLYAGAGTGSWSVLLDASNAIAVNTWTHLAAVRYGNLWMIFSNGNLLASTTNSVSASNTTEPATIGYFRSANPFDWNGYMQDLRITKGIARYTSNFTAPTAAFPLL